ncbi:hypothetical protein SLA2020_092680 [Shorea laevis]
MEQLPLEQRPRLLKDFFLDDSNSSFSSGFKSFPRRKCQDRGNPAFQISSKLILIQTDANYREADPRLQQGKFRLSK